MCGIAGFLDASCREPEKLAAAMAQAMRHRGPDSEGVWVDTSAGMALAHRRLAILDLTEAGRQPMASACGRYVLSYNGEIYNAPALMAELTASGHQFKGHSDTEVLVEGCAHWGVRKTLSRLVGMFAFALWDRRDRTLVLARDRVGIKPLHWGRLAGGGLMFASELSALRVLPNWSPALDRDAIAAFMRHNYIPAPLTAYQGVFKLPPGSMLTVRDGQAPVVEAYWRLEDAVMMGRANRLHLSDGEATDQLEALLQDAVKSHTLADVPVGAFLSGGIDSTTVVALMQKASGRPVRTFTIGFKEQEFDEAGPARSVAAHLGTDHTEMILTPNDALGVIDRLPSVYDEPFSDSSQIPTLILSELTRRHVPVALSGDGGDELFAGYNRYFQATRIWRKLALIPVPFRKALGAMILRLPPRMWDRLFTVLPGRWPGQAGDKMHKLAGMLAEDINGLYRRLVTHWDDPSSVVLGSKEPHGLLWDSSVEALLPDVTERMQYLDTLTYLPDDILTKVDRASMAVSLEARVPLLDHRVVEFAWSLPPSMRVRADGGKWLLRQVLYRHVPKTLVDRPKMGFGVPIDSWLRGALRPWAEDLLSEKRLREQGLLDVGSIRRRWEEHLAGARNWQYPLWDVLMLQEWLKRHGSGMQLQ